MVFCGGEASGLAPIVGGGTTTSGTGAGVTRSPLIGGATRAAAGGTRPICAPAVAEVSVNFSTAPTTTTATTDPCTQAGAGAATSRRGAGVPTGVARPDVSSAETGARATGADLCPTKQNGYGKNKRIFSKVETGQRKSPTGWLGFRRTFAEPREPALPCGSRVY